MRDWIRTADRLPEPHVSVLVWFEGGDEHFDVACHDPEVRFGPPHARERVLAETEAAP